MAPPIKPPEERFRSKYVIDEATGCWLWTANTHRNGYGMFFFDGRQEGAHRASYAMFVQPIPEGLVLDHLCRTKRCVNPAHLEAVTQGENIARGNRPTTGQRRPRAAQCKRGHAMPDKGPCLQCKAMRNRQRDRRKVTDGS